jgi:hypothetical protein
MFLVKKEDRSSGADQSVRRHGERSHKNGKKDRAITFSGNTRLSLKYKQGI